MRIAKIIFATIGIILTTLIVCVFLLAHMFSAGTHGSIKGYQYPVSKERLEDAINLVILENNSLKRPPQEDTLVFNPNRADYYNSDGYVTLSISAPKEYNYIFRFRGGEEDWKNSPDQSEIFICIASDNLGNGGSEGLGGVEWYRWGVKDKLTDYFEKNFIVKLDKKLGVTHQEKD
jgi:hypothetical protein